MIKNYLKLAFVFLLCSCASNFEEEKSRLLTKSDHKDLVSAFEIPKEEAKNFKENTEPPPAPVVTPVVTTKKNKIKKEKKVKQVVATPVIATPVKTEVGDGYPSDFPADFKNYDLKSKGVWEKFMPRFFQGEQSILAISYLGVVAGYITVTSLNTVKMGDKDTYHYTARFKSRDAYRYFYWLDDNLETFIDKKAYLPIKYSLIQREKKQNVDDLQLFDFKKLKTFNWYKRVKEGSNRDVKEEHYIPRYVQDSFSALQFTRGLPLKKGDTYDFPVVTRGEAWLLKVEVMGEETISVNDRDVVAIKVKAETHFPGVLQKSGDINFWYAADDVRRLLKFQAKVKLGSIFGELVDYKAGVLVK
jgi:hypothetical protein